MSDLKYTSPTIRFVNQHRNKPISNWREYGAYLPEDPHSYKTDITKLAKVLDNPFLLPHWQQAIKLLLLEEAIQKCEVKTAEQLQIEIEELNLNGQEICWECISMMRRCNEYARVKNA